METKKEIPSPHNDLVQLCGLLLGFGNRKTCLMFRRRRHDPKDPTKDSSGYWFAALLVLAALYIILKALKVL